MKMRTWLNANVSDNDILMMILGAMVAFVLMRPNDVSLTTVHQLGNTPYGILWVILNPLYWTNLPFKLYVFTFQIAVLIPMWWLVKKGRLNRVMVYLYLMTNTYSMWFTGFGVVSMTIFQPFVTINPALMLIGIAQIIPIWSFSLSDPHFQCALGNCISYTIARTDLNHDIVGLLMTPSTYGHMTSLFWMIFPLFAWWKRGHSQKIWYGDHYVLLWNETRFWMLGGMLLIGLFVATYLSFVWFGCCASWTFH